VTVSLGIHLPRYTFLLFLLSRFFRLLPHRFPLNISATFYGLFFVTVALSVLLIAVNSVLLEQNSFEQSSNGNAIPIEYSSN